MKIVTLSSGSKGNCTLVFTDNTKILIDNGLTVAEAESKLATIGVSPHDIQAILITHEHRDHIKGIEKFSQKYNSKIYAHINEWPALEQKFKTLPTENKIAFDANNFEIGDLQITNFELSHDANMCVGYSVKADGAKISIATDLGICPEDVIENLQGSDLVILEANHDEAILSNNPKYPWILKKRILSNKGHLSNKACAEVISRLVGGTSQIVLGHLSEENNSPSLAYKQVKTFLAQKGIIEGENIFIDVATQNKIGHIFDIKKKV